jgi:hypothetical protein
MSMIMTTAKGRSTVSNYNRLDPQPIAALIGLEASTLAVMSALHLTGILAGATRPYSPTAAGIAEAVICVVLTVGAAAIACRTRRGRATAVVTLAFAILGVLAGLTFTIRGGGAIDIAYHATILPLLLITLAATSSRPSIHTAPPAPVHDSAGVC